MSDDTLNIFRNDGSVVEVEHPFEPLKQVILARKLRFFTIREYVKCGMFTKEEAKELLQGPLAPGDDSTIFDDSGLLDLASDEEVDNMITLGHK